MVTFLGGSGPPYLMADSQVLTEHFQQGWGLIDLDHRIFSNIGLKMHFDDLLATGGRSILLVKQSSTRESENLLH